LKDKTSPEFLKRANLDIFTTFFYHFSSPILRGFLEVEQIALVHQLLPNQGYYIRKNQFAFDFTCFDFYLSYYSNIILKNWS